MRTIEDHSSFKVAALGLTLAIITTFQVYLWREPIRIELEMAADRKRTISWGSALFSENCDSCHGINGEGGVGPALNSKNLLSTVSNELLISLTRTGIPGTLMPAWGQAYGGPLTDEEIFQIIAFIRSWEPTAPEIQVQESQSDPVVGATIYAQTCFVCHGKDGKGTGNAPALNDPERLNKLDNAWYRNTIARGRPAKGMPTWGTVLSPVQINHLIALIDAWRRGESVQADISLSSMVINALFALREFDRVDAVFYLEQARGIAPDGRKSQLQAIITLIEENHLFEAQSLLISFLPPEEMGRAIYDTNCSGCHGTDGGGGYGPNLRGNPFIASKTLPELVEFLLSGRSGTPMTGFEGILAPEELENLVKLLQSWQEGANQ